MCFTSAAVEHFTGGTPVHGPRLGPPVVHTVPHPNTIRRPFSGQLARTPLAMRASAIDSNHPETKALVWTGIRIGSRRAPLRATTAFIHPPLRRASCAPREPDVDHQGFERPLLGQELSALAGGCRVHVNTGVMAAGPCWWVDCAVGPASRLPDVWHGRGWGHSGRHRDSVLAA